MNTNTLPILIVDDEPNITKALTRMLRSHYHVHSCNDSEQALQLIADNHFAIIISDMRMPKINGAELFAYSKQHQPQAVRIQLTGFSDSDSTLRAINEGQVYKYLTKPIDKQCLLLTLEDATNKFIQDKKDSQQTKELTNKNNQLQQFVHKLQQQSNILEANSSQKQRDFYNGFLEIANTFINDRMTLEQGHNRRIAKQARIMAESLKLTNRQCVSIYVAALLADIGKVSMSDELLNLAEHQLTPKQLSQFQQHVTKGAEILSNVTKLTEAADIVRHQLEKYAGKGYPDKLKGQDIPIGSRILLILKDYDRLLLGLKQPNKHTPQQAQRYLRDHADHLYDRKLVYLFIRLLKELPQQHNHFDFAITSSRLQVGAVLSEDVKYHNNNLFLTKYTTITEQLLKQIKHYEQTHGQSFTFYIY